MKRVAIWAAVSSLPQAKKVSLDDQLASGRSHAALHNASVVAELVVPGESRDIVLFEEACRRIGAYETLKGLIDNRTIDVLIYLDDKQFRQHLFTGKDIAFYSVFLSTKKRRYP